MIKHLSLIVICIVIQTGNACLQPQRHPRCSSCLLGRRPSHLHQSRLPPWIHRGTLSLFPSIDNTFLLQSMSMESCLEGNPTYVWEFRIRLEISKFKAQQKSIRYNANANVDAMQQIFKVGLQSPPSYIIIVCYFIMTSDLWIQSNLTN